MTMSDNQAADQPPIQHRTCGTMAVHFALLERHPEHHARLAELETATQQRMVQAAARPAGPVNIDVVVHVVFNAAAENISMAQVQSQIDVLNKDYNATN